MANLYLIKKLAEERGMQLNQLADIAHLSRQTIFQMIRNNTGTISSLEAVAKALGVPTGIFFDDYPSEIIGYGASGIAHSQGSEIDYITPETIALLRENIALLKDRIADKDAIIAFLKSRENKE